MESIAYAPGYVEGEPVNVMGMEYLNATALAVGGSKYISRIFGFIEPGGYDSEIFDDIVDRHGLVHKWERMRADLEDYNIEKPSLR